MQGNLIINKIFFQRGEKTSEDLDQLLPGLERLKESGSIFVKMPECPADVKTSQEERRMLNYKLGLLIMIASLALVSIVLISQQLIMRHLATDRQPPVLQLVSPGDGWRARGPHYRAEMVLSESHLVEEEEEGLYWSQEVVEPGLDIPALQAEVSQLRARTVSSLEEPGWTRCGQQAGQNRFVRFLGGLEGCARYREPHSHLVLGELMSFYLARLLGITSVPAVVLSRLEPDNPVWSSALQDVERAGWKLGSTVALIQWVEDQDLAGTNMPDLLRRALLDRRTLELSQSELTVGQAGELAQWSDLLVFDYLTANYDRVAAMLEAAEREGRPEVLSEPVHNLLTSRQTGRLWLIDNEAGLLDGYSLLYSTSEEEAAQAERLQQLQEDSLHTLCVFKRSTVAAVFALYKSGDAASMLGQFIARNEPLYQEMLQHLPGQQEVWQQHFQQRIEEVWIWMKQCQESVGFSHP